VKLGICQNCPNDCYNCISMQICVEKSTGCLSGCKRCPIENMGICNQCDYGFMY